MRDETLSPGGDDNYLWDRSGKPDAQLRQWEALLHELRAAAPVPDAPRFDHASRSRTRFRREGIALAAGLLLVVSAGLLWHTVRGAGVAVEVIAGSPMLSGARIEQRSDVSPGTTIETNGSSEARLQMGRIGWLHLGPDTLVQLVAADETRYLVSLRRGAVRADITAPPGVFVVDTPFATAIDLGCVYDLVVDDTGNASLTVESGWVALESPGRQSLVPEGARALARAEAGVGSPYYLDASPGFIAALALVDFETGHRETALTTVLTDARTRDALTLLTLIRRVDSGQRLRVYDRLRMLLPPPAGVTRAGIGAGDLAMIDLWWRALGLKFDKKPPVAISSR